MQTLTSTIIISDGIDFSDSSLISESDIIDGPFTFTWSAPISDLRFEKEIFRIPMTAPNGVAGEELGWSHYSIEAKSVSLSEVEFFVYSDVTLNERDNYTWELLSSNTPISYEKESILNLEHWEGVNPEGFSLVETPYSISLEYSAVPEPEYLGLCIAIFVLALKGIVRNHLR